MNIFEILEKTKEDRENLKRLSNEVEKQFVKFENGQIFPKNGLQKDLKDLGEVVQNLINILNNKNQ